MSAVPGAATRLNGSVDRNRAGTCDQDSATTALSDQVIELRTLVAAIPAQEPKGVDEVVLAGIVEEKVAAAVGAIPVPVAPELPDISKMVSDAVAAIPLPKDGVDGKDGKDGEPGAIGKDGRDGLDVKDLFVADGGELVVTLTDGRSKNLGKFRGIDGKDGAPGRDAELTLPEELGQRIAKAIKLMAETPETSMVQHSTPPMQPLNFHLPDIQMPEMKFPDVHFSLPEQQVPVVNVNVPEPRKRRTETTVTAYGGDGRIKKFVQKEVDD